MCIFPSRFNRMLQHTHSRILKLFALEIFESSPILGIASLLGNGLAVHVFRRKGTDINVPEVLLLNIAVVDLFLGIASYPATIVAAFSHRWLFGQTGTVTFSCGPSKVSLQLCLWSVGTAFWSNGLVQHEEETNELVLFFFPSVDVYTHLSCDSPTLCKEHRVRYAGRQRITTELRRIVVNAVHAD